MPALTGARNVGPADYVAPFDSATGLANALASFLRDRDHPLVGMVPRRAEPVLRPLSRLTRLVSRDVRKRYWEISGWQEAVPSRALAYVHPEDVASWFAAKYPAGPTDAVLLGSSNGAAIHLAAALRAPWLPQTFLVPVRRPMDPDDARADAAWGADAARPLLDRHPALGLHQMHDPIQDRPMLRHFAYFRLKHLRLPDAYARFITSRLRPGGTIYLVACRLRWPATRLAERHVFQHGGLGSASPAEYLGGSNRVAAFLERSGASRRSWDPPEPDGEHPEGEWGFDPDLERDVAELAEARRYRVRVIDFEAPSALSGPVADMHRRWYAERGIATGRVLAGSFLLLDPWWTLRTGSVPFWLTFVTDDALESLVEHLRDRPSLRELVLLLFQHGVDGIGTPSVERWRDVLGPHAERIQTPGLDDEAHHPTDLATYARYSGDLRTIPSRYPIPGPLTVARLERLLELGQAPGLTGVRLVERPAA